MVPDARQQGAGFGVEFQWDVPLLEGYRYVVLENVSRRPGVTHFLGCDTPSIAEFLGVRAEGGKLKAEGRSGAPNPIPAAPAAADHPSAVPQVSGLSPQPSPFDAVIINGWVVKSCLQALWACRRTGTPAILRCEACDLQPRAWWKTRIHRAILRRYSAFMAIGSANRQFYLRRGVPAERIVDGFYCVENERFAPGGPRSPRNTRKEFRQKWGIPEEAVCFLFCGKLEAKKRPLDILRALARLRASVAAIPAGEWEARSVAAIPAGEWEARSVAAIPAGDESQLSDLIPHPPLHLLMVGDGDLRPDCEAHARERRLPVTFAGFLNQSEMPNAYGATDCLVLPSDHGETWGLVVNEAMACGLPAIVSDRVGCHPDLIVPGETGAVFPCGDVEALAGLVRRFAADPDALRGMGHSAQELIQAYSVDKLVSGTLAALRLVCGR
jgi:glycosyltransferase involved in cell wall biosynthesis